MGRCQNYDPYMKEDIDNIDIYMYICRYRYRSMMWVVVKIIVLFGVP